MEELLPITFLAGRGSTAAEVFIPDPWQPGGVTTAPVFLKLIFVERSVNFII